MTKDRKKDHIDLTEQSRIEAHMRDDRFFYEPMLATHPNPNDDLFFYFLGKQFAAPMWISSMTGGTAMASKINKNLAKVCRDFSLGMGLGSCRKLLESDEFLGDFYVRPEIGDRPLYTNLGVAQLIELIQAEKMNKIDELIQRLEADGIIIHVNPVQEWLQPEGDRIYGLTPIEAVRKLVDHSQHKIIVKEVGQGIGPNSLKTLMKMPLAAVEFGAFGGTNFAKMEALRNPLMEDIDPISRVGHTAMEMISFVNDIIDSTDTLTREFIISGGVKTYLDGFYYNEQLKANSVYGQAAGYLKYAKKSYEALFTYVQSQIEGYKFAKRYLRIKHKEN